MTTNGRVISAKLYVKWTGSSVYIDESANIESFGGQIRLNPQFTSILANRSLADQVSVTLHNASNRYSSLLTSAGLYTEMSNGNYYQSPMYIEVSVDGGSNYYRIFTGVVKYVAEATKTAKSAGRVTLDCRSLEEVAQQTKLSTTAANFATYHNSNYTESQILAAWLADAGFSSGQYDLDTGYYCPAYVWLKDESPITSAWDLAAACGGRFYMDHPSSKFVYENKAAIAGKTVTTSIARSDFRDLTVKYPDVDLYKKISVTIYTGTEQPLDTVFTLAKPLQVAGGATVVKEFELDNPVISFTEMSYKAATVGGSDITSDVTITATLYAQKISFSIANANANAAYVRILTHKGYAVETDSSESTSRESTDTFWNLVGTRTREIANRYVQADAQAASLADMVLTATQTPLTSLEISDYLGNPQLKVGDVVSVQDVKIQSSNDDYFVTAISFRFSNAGFFQNIECTEVAQMVPWYGASSPDNYFELGTSKLGSVGAGIGRLYF